MKIARKFALATAAGMLTLGLVGVVTPASAADSAWGCGGWCKTGGGGKP
ncbi:hypothetical protein [Nocardioides sp.]|jgi:hypothetical protein|nr:hypothetical protein [Nocardioides sp.]MDE0776940.1 hypothetical protein [Nocardioides sp.]